MRGTKKPPHRNGEVSAQQTVGHPWGFATSRNDIRRDSIHAVRWLADDLIRLAALCLQATFSKGEGQRIIPA